MAPDTYTDATDMHDTHRTTFSHTSAALSHPPVHRWWVFSLLCLTFQLFVGLGSLHANEYPTTAGSLQLSHSGGSENALQLDANIRLTVKGLLAEISLQQTFSNTTDQWVDGLYLFPLDEQATIQGLQMQIGDRTITGKIMQHQAAQTTYKEAKDAGQIASLVEQQRPNLFTASVANIAPGATVVITLSLMMPVTVEQQRFQLRLPTTLTPRYSNAQTPDPESLAQPFTTLAASRGPRLNASIMIDGLVDVTRVESPTHSLQFDDASIALTDVTMNKDIVLHWPVDVTDVTSGKTFVTQHDGQRYVQILLNPPALSSINKTLARELILVIDKSGSMAGVSMAAAQEALHFAIDGLADQDTFNLVAFDNQYQSLFQRAMPVTNETRRQARRFTDALIADGGTEMQEALSFALKQPLSKAEPLVEEHNNTDNRTSQSEQIERLRQVVFMTDGSVGYEEALLASIKSALGKSRLFTVGIGPAPNSWFLEKAAEVGRGVSLNIQDSHDVAGAVTRLLTQLSSPVLTDITVQYPAGHGETYPAPLPDLYADKPGMWVSRISSEVSEIIVTGKHYGERWSTTLPITSQPSEAVNAPAVAMNWARGKIDHWLDEQRYSADPNLHERAITELALSMGLVTRYTSFIAVEQTPVKPEHVMAQSHSVANLIPAGNTMMSVAMPVGAAGADTLSLISLLLGLSGAALLRLSRSRWLNTTGHAA